MSCRLTFGLLWLGIFTLFDGLFLLLLGYFCVEWTYELPCQDKLPEFHYIPIVCCIRVFWLVFQPLGLDLDKALFGWNSVTHQSATPPVRPANHPSDCPSPSDHLCNILPCPSGSPTSSDHTSLQPSPSDHPPPSHHLYDTPISLSSCPSPANCLTATTTHLPICPSSPTIHHTQDSSQSLAVMNGEQSCKAKKFHRAFTNYDLLLCALDASSIYLHDSRHVAPPKSEEDAHVTHGRSDFGGTTLNKPSLGFSYVLPRLWDPGGVRSPPNVPSDLSSALAPSRYPYTTCTGHLVNLPNLRRWQDLRTSHVKLNIFIHGNITGLNIAMTKITRSINVIIPALT